MRLTWRDYLFLLSNEKKKLIKIDICKNHNIERKIDKYHFNVLEAIEQRDEGANGNLLLLLLMHP